MWTPPSPLECTYFMDGPLQNSLTMSSQTMHTLVGERYNLCNHFLRLSGFPDLFGKVFLTTFKFS